jgi:sulfate adenylyltransferase
MTEGLSSKRSVVDVFDLMAGANRRHEMETASSHLPSWDLTPRQLCDLELLMSGGFAPLRGFLCRADYEAVCERMRLADGSLWPIPVVLDLPEQVVKALRVPGHLGLRDSEGDLLAVLHCEEIWQPDRRAEAERVYGTVSRAHPGVRQLLDGTHDYYIGGRIEGLRMRTHYDFPALRLTPSALRTEFARRGWRQVVAFQTRNPMHRGHFEMTRRAMQTVDANLLIHPAVGATGPGDVDHYTRVRCYQAILPRYPPDTAMVALLPLAMRMAGPREALWHAIIRKNHGCSHLIVGRDHAGPGRDEAGKPFYDPYAAHDLLRAHGTEIGIGIAPFQAMAYAPDLDAYISEPDRGPGTATLDLSGTELRSRLREGRDIPEWFTFPEVAAHLRRRHPPRARQGVTIFLTGLSGAGKSTIASVLLAKILERGGRAVSLLDGDAVRKNLSSELGFSRSDRDTNIRRIGFVASEVTRHGGIAICAAIAPYDGVRKEVRAAISPHGGFVLVHVTTPLDVCERRDRKGLYAKARAGVIPQFTGISDPYEAPDDADITVGPQDTAEQAAQRILTHLEQEGFLPSLEA